MPQKPVTDEDFQRAWAEVLAGKATEDEKIDLAVATGREGRTEDLNTLRTLIDDESSEVRLYVLQTIGLDLNQGQDWIEPLCWRLMREDPDDGVRSMAAACLGKTLFNSRSATAFEALVEELRTPSQSDYVKGSVYNTLFQVVGRLPSEWPLHQHIMEVAMAMGEQADFSFGTLAVDWAKVESLRKELKLNS